MKKFRILAAIIIIILIIVLGIIIYICTYHNKTDRALADAGIIEKEYVINNVVFNYAEGPDNGEVLVLLHAQTLDWYSYSNVLPELSKSYHVYAIDYPGHGKTIIPSDYEMSANQIGKDLADFIREVIGKPVYLTGNSSGGLLCVWLAAYEPDIVKAVVLEDPPLFSSEYNELSNTVADKLFTLSSYAVNDDNVDEFFDYWMEHSDGFFVKYAGGKVGQTFLKWTTELFRISHPEEPVEVPFVSSTVQEMIRGMNYYNPRFGAAFHDGSWNEGFDHATALKAISCPVLLIQANYSYLDDGTLDGAMSKEMADRVVTLIDDCEYVKVDSGHVTNLEIPDEFIQIVSGFCRE